MNIKYTITAISDRPENCNFETHDMCKWINMKNDDFNWQLWKGPTPSRMTGPSFGHGGQGRKYMHICL